MGDRYFLEITCPQCGFHDDDVYYAPTCGFTDWKCQKCGHAIDLEKYTGISYEEASNAAEIEAIISIVQSNKACTRQGRAVREPEARICPHCGYLIVVSSRGRFHNHGSRSNPCPGSGMYIEPTNPPAPCG